MEFITQENLRNKRRNQSIKQKIPYIVDGERKTIEKNLINGEMEVINLLKPLNQIYGEMITNSSFAAQTRNELTQKTVLDVELGREETPILYEPIYDRLTDPNFPQILDAKWATYGDCVFLEHLEGEEIKFGSISAEEGPTARIKTWTSGFEYTQEMFDYNETYLMNAINTGVGRAYNALLNHIHFAPIISYDYSKRAKNNTKAQKTTGYQDWQNVQDTLNKGFEDSIANKRTGSILLINPLDQRRVKQAMSNNFTASDGKVFEAPSISTVIAYGGYSVTVGNEKYEYEGVPQGVAFLIRPKLGFKELIKKDLTVESNLGDRSRLIKEQMIAWAYRGVFAAIEENVQRIELP